MYDVRVKANWFRSKGWLPSGRCPDKHSWVKNPVPLYSHCRQVLLEGWAIQEASFWNSIIPPRSCEPSPAVRGPVDGPDSQVVPENIWEVTELQVLVIFNSFSFYKVACRSFHMRIHFQGLPFLEGLLISEKCKEISCFMKRSGYHYNNNKTKYVARWR